MKKLSLLLEEKTLNLKWPEVARLMSAKFIHEHPESGEAELEYNGKHLLIEDEKGKISISVVSKVIDDLKKDFQNDFETLDEKAMANMIIEKMKGK